MRALALAAFVAALSAVAGGAAVRPRGVAARVVVPCERAIEIEPPPAPTADDRVLFGRVAFPREDELIQMDYVRRGRPFRYGQKRGIEVRGGRGPVDVIVPATWKNRLAIAWGGKQWASMVRFLGCRSAPGYPWLAYAGGFSVRAPACAHLVIRVGGQNTRIRLSLGRPCQQALSSQG